jgi:quinol monooxygenase YgiN
MADEFIIAGWLDYGPHRDDVLKHFVVCAAESRKEPGCLDYVVTPDPEESGRIVVLERWESLPQLEEHFRTQHVADFRAAAAPYPRLGRHMYRYFISRSEEMSSTSSPAEV